MVSSSSSVLQSNKNSKPASTKQVSLKSQDKMLAAATTSRVHDLDGQSRIPQKSRLLDNDDAEDDVHRSSSIDDDHQRNRRHLHMIKEKQPPVHASTTSAASSSSKRYIKYTGKIQQLGQGEFVHLIRPFVNGRDEKGEMFVWMRALSLDHERGTETEWWIKMYNHAAGKWLVQDFKYRPFALKKGDDSTAATLKIKDAEIASASTTADNSGHSKSSLSSNTATNVAMENTPPSKRHQNQQQTPSSPSTTTSSSSTTSFDSPNTIVTHESYDNESQ